MWLLVLLSSFLSASQRLPRRLRARARCWRRGWAGLPRLSPRPPECAASSLSGPEAPALVLLPGRWMLVTQVLPAGAAHAAGLPHGTRTTTIYSTS